MLFAAGQFRRPLDPVAEVAKRQPFQQFFSPAFALDELVIIQKCVEPILPATVPHVPDKWPLFEQLDVFPKEPQIAPGLLDCPRLVLAPHIGSATTEARTAMAQLCADAVIHVLRGHRPPNLVNVMNQDVTLAWNRRS